LNHISPTIEEEHGPSKCIEQHPQQIQAK